MNTSPQNNQELLAHTISETFNDQEHLSLYLNCCKKYPLNILYRAYAEAKAVPPERVRKSRAAIFFYLIKRYSHERKQNTGH